MSENSPIDFPFVFRSDLSPAPITASLESYLNYFSISVSVDTDPTVTPADPPSIPPITASNASVKVIIDNADTSSSEQSFIILTPNKRYITDNIFTFHIIKSSTQGIIVDSNNVGYPPNSVGYPLINNTLYICKIYLTLSGVDYKSDPDSTPTFRYYETRPSFSPFTITQLSDSTNFTIDNMIMNNLPLVVPPSGPSYNQLPSLISMAFDELDGHMGDKNSEMFFTVHLNMDNEGNGDVVNNLVINGVTQVNDLIPLPDNSSNNNTGDYVIDLSMIPHSHDKIKKNTGYYASVSASFGNGVYYSFQSASAVKVWNLEPVVINSISCYDATAPAGVSPSQSTQQLISVTLQTYDASNNPYWGNIYTPNSVTFTLRDNESSPSTFNYTTPYLNTLYNGSNPSYNIRLKDMVPVNSGDELLNGVSYNLTVTVNWNTVSPATSSSMVATSRSSIWDNTETDVIFQQGVEPITDLELYNAWEALSMDNSELISSSMPDTGIILSFKKTNQFDSSAETDNLDIAGTQFKVEYKIGDGVGSDWELITRGSILQPDSTLSTPDANIRNASTLLFDASNNPVEDVTDGLFDLPLPPLSGLGADQAPVYIYLPNTSSYVFNASSDTRVFVRVSILAGSSSYDPKLSASVSESLFIVKKPAVYAWDEVNNGLEPFINPIKAITDSSLTVTITGSGKIYNAPVTQVIADSNVSMITTTSQGWNVVNNPSLPITSQGTYTATLRKINLYYYTNAVPPSFTLNNLNGGLGFYLLCYNNPGSMLLPFITVYTSMDSLTTNRGTWYKSALTYVPAPTRLLSDPSMTGLTLLYTGTEPSVIPHNIPSHRCIKCNLLITSPPKANFTGNAYMSESIFTASLQTDSGSPQKFNFNIRAAGVQGGQVDYSMNFGLTVSMPLKTEEDSDDLAGCILTATTPSLGYYGSTTTSMSYDDFNLPIEVGTSLQYKIAKIFNDPNSVGNTLTSNNSGLITIDSKAMPNNTDYIVANTVSSDGAGILYIFDNNSVALVFDLTIASTSITRRIDGVDLFITDVSGNQIQYQNFDADSYNTLQHVNLSLSSDDFNIGQTYTVTFKPYRDPHVLSDAEILYSDPSQWDVTSFNFLDSQVSNTPNKYSWVTGDANEPFMTYGNLTLVIPLDNEQTNYYSGAQIMWGYSGSPMTTLVNALATDSSVSILVNAGSVVNYTVTYLYTDAFSTIIPGPVSNTFTVDCEDRGTLADCIISLTSGQVQGETRVNKLAYTTFNNSGNSSISFNLNFAPRSGKRIDGVAVYFESDDSNIPSTYIGNFTTSGDKTMYLLSSPGQQGILQTLGLTWNDYTSANITFKSYRDDRVSSVTLRTEGEDSASIYTEPGYIWNIPVIPTPSSNTVNGVGITLSGGIICDINTGYGSTLNWVRDTSQSFTYTVTMSSNTNSTPNTMNISSTLNSAPLTIDAVNTDTYTVSIKKWFQGQSSEQDLIVFTSAVVDTSPMVVSVENPSTDSSLKVSWPSYTNTGANIVYSKLVDTTAPQRYIDNTTGNVIENNVSHVYSLPSSRFPLGSVLLLGVSVSANVNYFLNSGSAVQSSPNISLVIPNITTYITSSVPNISLNMGAAVSSSTVLLQNTTTPSLLLNLDARGLETVGFISLVLILTQDGTPDKPEGVETILQFPAAPSSSSYSSSSNSFLFPNNIVGSTPTENLLGGESSTVSPLSISPTGLSNPNPNPPSAIQYTLKIGSPTPAGGRYGWSSLTFPASNVSGFVDGQEANIMGILTTNRGTDIMVGSFIYSKVLTIQNVNISNQGGNYYVNFNVV